MKALPALLLLGLFAFDASAQFTGPSATGRQITVSQVRQARLGSYRDATGDIRVEIENSVWQNRQVGPDTKVELLAEVDQGFAGRYLWVKSLRIVE